MENRHYPSLDEYVDAVAAALRTEYQAIVERGLLLQIDAPDLAMERHTLFADRPLGEFLDVGRDSSSTAINGALDGIDPVAGAAARLLGQLRGSAHPRRRRSTTSCRCSTRRTSARSSCRWPTPATPTSTAASSATRCPTGMVLVAGVIDTTSNYVEHPEVVADRLAIVSPRRSAIPAGSSPAPTAASTRRPASATSPPRSCGRSSRPARRRRPRLRPPALNGRACGPTRPAGSLALAPPGATWHEPRTGPSVPLAALAVTALRADPAARPAVRMTG